jgi:hypothetical protein
MDILWTSHIVIFMYRGPLYGRDALYHRLTLV